MDPISVQEVVLKIRSIALFNRSEILSTARI